MSKGIDNSTIIRPVRAIVDLGRIRHNISYLQSLLSPGTKVIAVVKANAYGHGDLEISRIALDAGVERLGVALVEEGIRIRRAGIQAPIHVLFEPPPGAAPEVVKQGFICTVYTAEMAKALSESASGNNPATVHIKVDTGMHRVGVQLEELGSFCEFIKGLTGVEVEGICTHFACAEEPGNSFTDKQLRLFREAAELAEARLGKTLLKHAANSAAAMSYPPSHLDMVRLGVAIYGLPPSDYFRGDENLLPALRLETKVMFNQRLVAGEGVSYGLNFRARHDTNLATIPLGYADGYTRLISGSADVLIEGKRYPVVGNICMDMCMVNTGDRNYSPGQVVTVMGEDGEESVTADEIADKLGTINYEVVCMISARVPRVFVSPK